MSMAVMIAWPFARGINSPLWPLICATPLRGIWRRRRCVISLSWIGFRAKFAGSPIKRIGRDRFIRNVLYAIGNSGNPSYAPLVQPLMADADPAVAEAAGWALARITP